MSARLPAADHLPPVIQMHLNAVRVSSEAFATEREALATRWIFPGFGHQIAATDDWFRTVLGGRSIIHLERFRL